MEMSFVVEKPYKSYMVDYGFIDLVEFWPDTNIIDEDSDGLGARIQIHLRDKKTIEERGTLAEEIWEALTKDSWFFKRRQA